MNKNSWNEWLTLVANLSVVAGIVFLAVEIRQNTQVLEESAKWSRIQGLEANYEQYSRWRMRLFEDTEMREIWSRGCNGELESDDLFRYRLLARESLVMDRNTWERALAANVVGWRTAASRATAQNLLDCPGLLAEFKDMSAFQLLSQNWYNTVEAALSDLQSADQ